MGDGGVGTRACTLRYAVWFDVTWCDVVDPRRAPRDTLMLCCACRTCNCKLAPLRAPPRGTNRRAAAAQPPPAHGKLRERSPSAKGPLRIPRSSTPQCPPAIPAERGSPSAAHRVRRPPPELRFKRPPAGRDKWFRSRAKAGSRAARSGRGVTRGARHLQLHSAAPRPPLQQGRGR